MMVIVILGYSSSSQDQNIKGNVKIC